MKTKLLLSTLFIFAGLFAFSQNLVVMHDGVDLEPNEVIQVIDEATVTELVVHFDIKNTSSSTIETNVTRYLVTLSSGHVHTFCWAGLCYAPPTVTSPNTVNIDGGTVHEDDFSGHINPYGNEGTSVVAYTFFDVNNPSDSVQVVVEYLAGTVGVEDFAAEKLNVSTYPNPASDVLTFTVDAENNDLITYELLSITGATVRTEATIETNVKFNVSDLSEGLYLYRVSTDKDIIKTGRVVIKH
jgi:hypothetical protein